LAGIYETFNISRCNAGTGYFSAVWLWIQYGVFLVLFALLFSKKARERSGEAKKDDPKTKKIRKEE